MNFDEIVRRGCCPWLPHKDAADLDALHVHDIPLIGVFELDGRRVLFACLTGALLRRNVWGYTVLSEDEESALSATDFDSTAALEDWAHARFIGKPVVLASAFDCVIEEWARDEVDEAGVLEAAIRFMDMQIARLSTSEAARRAQQRQAEQARADATLRTLEPA